MRSQCTLWYRYDKTTDSYKYNHLEFGVHATSRIHHGSTISNSNSFRTSKWLKDFRYIEDKKVI
jgi:hypothetical protein